MSLEKTYAKYGLPFQRKVIFFLLRDQEFTDQFGRLIKPEYFQNTMLQLCARCVREYTERYEGSSLTKESFLTEAIKQSKISRNGLSTISTEEMESFWDESLSYDPSDKQYIRDCIIEFARNQTLGLAILKSAKGLSGKNPNFGEIQSDIADAIDLGKEYEDYGSIYFRDSKNRLLGYVEDAKSFGDEEGVGTGFHILDSRLPFGKMFGGELFVVAAPMGRFKTTMLVNFACNALMSPGQVVFYYSGEVSERKLNWRMDSILTGFDVSELHQPQNIGEALRRIGRIYTTNKSFMVIKRFYEGDSSIDDLKAHMKLVKSLYKVKPTMIIIDYVEHLKHTDRQERSDITIASTYRLARSWGARENCPVFTASQLTRKSIGKYHTDERDLAEAISKAAIADVLVTICQDDDEYESKIFRVFFAKNRDAEGRAEYIKFKIQYPRLIEEGVLSRHGE